MRRLNFRHLLLGVLIGQLFVLGYIARLEYQIRSVTALSYLELVDK